MRTEQVKRQKMKQEEIIKSWEKLETKTNRNLTRLERNLVRNKRD